MATRAALYAALLAALAVAFTAGRTVRPAYADVCSTSQGAGFHAIVRERQALRARPRAVHCLAAGDHVANARIVWGDGTSTPVAVRLIGEGPAHERVILRGIARHRYGRANCPAARRLLYRCRAGYRMVLRVLDSTAGKTAESEPVAVSVLAAGDRIAIGSVRNVGHFQVLTARVTCGGVRRGGELRVTVLWGRRHRSIVRLNGSSRSFGIRLRHWREGKGPRYVTLVLRDRLALDGARTTRILRP